MKQKFYAVVLLFYIILIGKLNKNIKIDFYGIQHFLYFAGLGILAYMLYKHTDKDTLKRLPLKMGIYFFIVVCLIVFFAIGK